MSRSGRKTVIKPSPATARARARAIVTATEEKKARWARVVFGVAQQANARAKANSHPFEPLIALVFSVAFLEAFINELLDAAVSLSARTRNKKILTLAAVGQSVLDGGANMDLRGKFRLAKIILSGKRYSEGRAPFQDFATLIGIRNWLIHMKDTDVLEVVETQVGSKPKTLRRNVIKPAAFMKRFRARLKALGVKLPREAPSWLHLADPRVAEWACKTAVEMIEDMHTWQVPAVLQPFLKPYVGLTTIR